MKELIYEAMQFARHAHAGQKRKYTAEPYSGHLAEVAGIVASVTDDPEVLATDAVEDQHVDLRIIAQRFGPIVAEGVAALSDVEEDDHEKQEAAARERLHRAEPWVQTIKVADIISNSSSRRVHEPDGAARYLADKRAMLAVLDRADARLMEIARLQTA